MATNTPWGKSQYKVKLAPGIISYGTSGHGGFHLAPKLYAQLPAELRMTFAGGAWYEEDCDWAIPYTYFNTQIREYLINNPHADEWERDNYAAKTVIAWRTLCSYKPNLLHLFTRT